MIASPISAVSRRLPSWERLAAGFIDWLVLLIPEIILAVIFASHAYSRLFSYIKAHKGESNLSKDPRFVHLSHLLSTPLVHFLIASEAVTAIYLIGMYLGTGATLGKLALGLRITRVDGHPLTAWDAVLRSLVFWVPLLIPIIGIWLWLLQYVGGTLVMLFRPDHRGPEDLIAGTIVVPKNARGSSLAEMTGYITPNAPPPQPPDAPVRGGHLPGWGPANEQQPPPPDQGPGETPS
ncbi:MAG TPA: RDD family protein [Candidatus Dormibacteraeota bacterium]|nr:RDD family protein [Candidatus Dormibacteraeota bacterium]